MSNFYDFKLDSLQGKPDVLGNLKGKVSLAVNVASMCGLTPQYAGLEDLQEKLGAKGFNVVGFPCNQFGAQEPGTADEIETFCSTTYGVTFPMMEKVRVNGHSQHPLYTELTKTPDASGKAGKVKWNFEKFVITPTGEVHRFRPHVEPDAPEILQLIEASLPVA